MHFRTFVPWGARPPQTHPINWPGGLPIWYLGRPDSSNTITNFHFVGELQFLFWIISLDPESSGMKYVFLGGHFIDAFPGTSEQMTICSRMLTLACASIQVVD